MWPFTGNVRKPARRHPTARLTENEQTQCEITSLREIPYPHPIRYCVHFCNNVWTAFCTPKCWSNSFLVDTTQRPRWQNRNYASLIIITYKLCRCRKIVVDFFVCAVGVVTRCHHTVCQQIIIFALRLFLSHNTRWGAFLLFRFCFVRRLHWQIRTYTICSLSPLSIFTFFHSDSLEMEERKKKKKSFRAFS